jgi:hypothetical protein
MKFKFILFLFVILLGGYNPLALGQAVQNSRQQQPAATVSKETIVNAPPLAGSPPSASSTQNPAETAGSTVGVTSESDVNAPAKKGGTPPSETSAPPEAPAASYIQELPQSEESFTKPPAPPPPPDIVISSPYEIDETKGEPDFTRILNQVPTTTYTYEIEQGIYSEYK